MTIPSRLDRRDAPRPHHAPPCPARFPGEPSTTCEGIEGHAGPHLARVTVTWVDEPATAPTPAATAD